MSICIFTGPTLSAMAAREHVNAHILPPAAQGDVYLALKQKPVAIGIIDGYFERVPSVSHKEILWAMANGVHVFGAASMGALRAVELSMFGMEGVGAVYESYARGDLEADDEVAVAHAAAEDGYRPLSEAMVNIRATLHAAEAAGVVTSETREKITSAAKSLFYPERCYPILLRRAASEGICAAQIDGLRAFLSEHRVDQKRRDALDLLRVMQERFGGRVEPKQVRYHFEPTDAWEVIRERANHRAATAKESIR